MLNVELFVHHVTGRLYKVNYKELYVCKWGPMTLTNNKLYTFALTFINTGLFISPPVISELDCATTETDTAERSISIGRESLQFFLY